MRFQSNAIRSRGSGGIANLLLYATTVTVWGTSWLAITFQLGQVAPEASVTYRFALAALILVAFCLASGRSLRFGAKEHVWIAIQGLFLFSTNYILVYFSTQYLTSGLVAVAFSSVVVLNIMGGAVFLATPMRPRVVSGALLGIAGIGLVFGPELQSFDLSRTGTQGLVLCLLGTLSASLGMLTSARNQRRGLPVIQTNAIGMAYGTAIMAGFTVLGGRGFGFDPSFAYTASLLYLAVFATVIAFWSHLTLLGRIGADRASYAAVLFPIIALALSTAFEGFVWTASAGLGVVMVIAGNGLVLARDSRSTRDPLEASRPRA